MLLDDIRSTTKRLWDEADRRASHADRRKALQASSLQHEFSRAAPRQQTQQKFRTQLQRLLRITLTG